MELTLDMNEVAAALRAKYPEIPPKASVQVVFRPGRGPGSHRNTKGCDVQPFVTVTFDLPEPEEKPEP